MDAREYQDACERTAPTAGRRDRLSNFALGLGAEATSEVLSIVITRDARDQWFPSELGDCLWYVAAIASTCGIEMPEVLDEMRPARVDADPIASAIELVVACGDIQDAVRVELHEARSLAKQEVVTLLARVAASLRDLASGRDHSLAQIMDINIAKLATGRRRTLDARQ